MRSRSGWARSPVPGGRRFDDVADQPANISHKWQVSTLINACRDYLAVRALLFSLALTLGCEPLDVARSIEEKNLPMEIWDFSEGLDPAKANWGAEGWETATEISDAQFKGPVYLRILLPDDRAIEGKFELVRATRDRGQLSVSFLFPASSAEQARDTVFALLGSADEALSRNNQGRVEAWYEAGPEAGPGEELNLILSEAGSSTVEIGVTIDWVPIFGDRDGRWRVFGRLGPMPLRK